MDAFDAGGVTAREAEILAAIGRRLTNAEIAAEMFVSVRTVESHVSALRRKLAVTTRAELMAHAAARQRRRVRPPANSFVGRERELVVLDAARDGHRVGTIVGPPGAGKSRLALEWASRRPGGALVVDLERVDRGRLLGAIGAAIGMAGDSAASPLAAVVEALRISSRVLVLDNCDLVLEDTVSTVDSLVRGCEQLFVLATSRTRLGMPAEHVVELGPLRWLASPDDQREGSVAVPAVQLFLDRAAVAAPGVRLDGERDEIVGCCELVEGLPLAIELAAMRVRQLSPGELRRQLARGVGVLDGPTGLRHSSLEGTIRWTLDQLPADQHGVLDQLAVLPTSFDLDCAEALCGPGAARSVVALLDRSLLSVAGSWHEPRRFRLLGPVRDVVRGRAEPGLENEVRGRHAHQHAARLRALADRVAADDALELVERARDLRAEAVATLEWAMIHDAPLAGRLAGALATLAEHGAADPDSLNAIRWVAASPDIVSAATAVDLRDIGVALTYVDVPLVGHLGRELLRRGDDLSVANGHFLVGLAAAYQGRAVDALRHLAVAEECAAAGDARSRAKVHQTRGTALLFSGDHAGALASYELAAHHYALANDRLHLYNCRYMMASAVAQAGGDTDNALTWLDGCEAAASRTGNDHELAHARLARIRLTLGSPSDDQPSTAITAALDELLDTFTASGDLRCSARTRMLLADATQGVERAGHLERAAHLAIVLGDDEGAIGAVRELIRSCRRNGDNERTSTALGLLGALCANRPNALADLDDELRSWLPDADTDAGHLQLAHLRGRWRDAPTDSP